MTPKPVIMMQALCAGHEFTSSDGITMMCRHDEEGQYYIMMREDESGEMFELSVNQFLSLCHTVSDEEMMRIEALINDPLPEEVEPGPVVVDLTKPHVLS